MGSVRDTMLKKAVDGLMDFGGDPHSYIHRESRKEFKPYVVKTNHEDLFGTDKLITCYMCDGDNGDADMFTFGVTNKGNCHVIYLCKHCQEMMKSVLGDYNNG